MANQCFTVEPGVELNIEIDDYTNPWAPAETILMVHGLAESTAAWRGWVPHLARHYRVARLDLRGFGRSTPMAADYHWEMSRLLDDLAAVIKHLGCEQVHLAAALTRRTLPAACPPPRATAGPGPPPTGRAPGRPCTPA